MTPNSSDGSILHMGDNVTGIASGDDEAIKIHLDAVSERTWAMVMVISCFKGSMQIVRNMSVRCAEITTMASRHGGYEQRQVELAQFPVQVDEEYWEHHKHMHHVNQSIAGQTAMCMWTLYRGDKIWMNSVSISSNKTNHLRNISILPYDVWYICMYDFIERPPHAGGESSTKARVAHACHGCSWTRGHHHTSHPVRAD